MQKENNTDIQDVKKLNIVNIGADIKKWIEADPSRSRELFAANAGVSMRRVESILAYKEGDSEPNLTSSTINGIMGVLSCETYYTPKHEIK